MTKFPKISVVTVNFNMAGEIAGTLDSVLGQDYPNFESIVIDGASTDGSPEIIASYDERFADSHVLSAMFSQSHADADAIYGHYIRRYPEQGIDRLVRAEPPNVLPLRMHCSHQSLFMRRDLLLQRPFSLGLLAADYEAVLHAYIAGRRFKGVDCVVAVASVGGRSDNNRITMLVQRISILRGHGLLSLKIAVHYALLIAWAIIASAAKKALPKFLVTYILGHRPINGLG